MLTDGYKISIKTIKGTSLKESNRKQPLLYATIFKMNNQMGIIWKIRKDELLYLYAKHIVVT